MKSITSDFDIDQTVGFHYKQPSQIISDALNVTIFDSDNEPTTVNLSSFGKGTITFGRNSDCDIVLKSHIVSKLHGSIIKQNGVWTIEDHNSTNGLIYNDKFISNRELVDGDIIRIDDNVQTIAEGVLMLFSTNSDECWKMLSLQSRSSVSIGRETDCDVCLSHISVSKHHATMTLEGNKWKIVDSNSTNGLLVNGVSVSGSNILGEKAVITITNSKLIFTSKALYYCTFNRGVSVEAQQIVIERKAGRKKYITCNHVSLEVKPGELIAIIGGSGAGKSTVLNAMSGYLTPTLGNVYLNGIDLYSNFDALKKIIGYVPQQDIVYDDLSLYDMLEYTSRLRLPSDTSDEERERAIEKAIAMVELSEKKGALIKALSGGQRKRASIAVELLSDPNLIFLDEPSSGLDPGTERNLMHSLREMANSGKTIILVTHSTLQLRLCDKIVFMGKGGNLCYFGSYDDALDFFEVSDIVDVYNMITENAPFWREKYNVKVSDNSNRKPDEHIAKKQTGSRTGQLWVLSQRYFKLVLNDRQRFLLLMLQAPLLAVLIAVVADGNQNKLYTVTQSLLFALSCVAFWIGMLNSIQEICKERTILKREYMAGLSLSSYLFSKILILGLMCLVQSILVIGVYSLLVGIPESGVMMSSFLEMLVSTFLTSLAAASMGLAVSSLFSNADRAMTVAPILLLPQILFSGLIFPLEGAAEPVSWITICRWSMESYGTTANLNELPLQILDGGIIVSADYKDFFEFSSSHLALDWIILIVFSIAFLAFARIALSRIANEQS